MWAAFERLKVELESRYESFKNEVTQSMEHHHSENRLRLQNIDAQSVEIGRDLAAMNVKIDRLHGVGGQPGAVDKLGDKVEKLGNKIVYASGFLAAVVLLVGWYIEHVK